MFLFLRCGLNILLQNYKIKHRKCNFSQKNFIISNSTTNFVKKYDYMQMKKITIVLISTFILFAHCIPVLGWGGKGHYVIAGIAEMHLNNKAKKEVQRLLGGRTMVYYSTWMDEIRSDSAYGHTRTWHYANVDEGKTYETMKKEPNGDVITATLLSISQLKNKNQPDSIRSMYLKLLIHLIADMHCLMHAGRNTDRGGNNYLVKWKNTSTNLHYIWDVTVIDEARNWNSIEWVKYTDIGMSRRQRQAIEAGTPLDWFNETVALAKDVYKNTPENQTVPQSYVRKYTPVIEEQFLKAGYRLAYLLNTIFK